MKSDKPTGVITYRQHNRPKTLLFHAEYITTNLSSIQL